MDKLVVDERYVAFLADRRAQILGRIERAAASAGRDPGSVTLVAVSKTVDVDAVVAAKRAGYAAFGENRPQELERKLAALEQHGERTGTSWHMIGNLQTNKINHVLACGPDLVHSVSSIELARAMAKRAAAAGTVQRVLVEVNVSGEASKSGVSPDEMRARAEDWKGFDGPLKIAGLMTMAPADDPDAAARTFEGLRDLRDELCRSFGMEGLDELSMGMSGDYELAVERGATIVRLGRIVFDPDYELGNSR